VRGSNDDDNDESRSREGVGGFWLVFGGENTIEYFSLSILTRFRLSIWADYFGQSALHYIRMDFNE